VLKDGTEIKGFDFLCICTGSYYEKIKFQEDENKNKIKIIRGNSSKDILKHFQEIIYAKDITIIGAGQ
jgi:hypothetical protein